MFAHRLEAWIKTPKASLSFQLTSSTQYKGGIEEEAGRAFWWPPEAVGQSEQGQALACCCVSEDCLSMFTNGSGGKQGSTEEAGKMRRKARGDGAVGEGEKGTTMLASGLAESRKWRQSRHRGGLRFRRYDYEPKGTDCDPTHTEPL
ncbi:hypothetical protein ABVT39_012575 [Epinephelus coioides]